MRISLAEQETIVLKAHLLLLWATGQGWTADRTTTLAFRLVARMAEGTYQSVDDLAVELAFLIAEAERDEGAAG